MEPTIVGSCGWKASRMDTSLNLNLIWEDPKDVSSRMSRDLWKLTRFEISINNGRSANTGGCPDDGHSIDRGKPSKCWFVACEIATCLPIQIPVQGIKNGIIMPYILNSISGLKVKNVMLKTATITPRTHDDASSCLGCYAKSRQMQNMSLTADSCDSVTQRCYHLNPTLYQCSFKKSLVFNADRHFPLT